MGIYSKNSILESTSLDNIDARYEDQYEPTLEGAYLIVAESEQNWSKLMESAGIDELNYLEENGVEMPYTEGAGSQFFESAKTFFKGLLEKIKALFKRFFSMFDSMIKSDKEFIGKYKKDLVKVTGTDKFKYKGFNYSIPSSKVNMNVSIGSPTNKDIDMTDWQEEFRGKVCGGGSQTASEFTKELFAAYRSGESSKEEIEGVTVTNVISWLEGSAKMKSEAEKSFKTITTNVNNAIKETDKLQKELVNSSIKDKTDNSDKITLGTMAIECQKNGLAILQIANGALLSAIKSCSSQNKAIASKLLTFKAAKEGFEYGENGSVAESAVSNIQFI